ncbi:hypothetical protein JCM5350_004766 [Sporobolomyces pararoseus]
MTSKDVLLSQKIQTLEQKIIKERKILEGFQAMRSATTNQDVIRTCESKIRESFKTIGWFEESVRELKGRNSFDSGSNSTTTTTMGGVGSVPPGAAPSYVQPSGYGANPLKQGRVGAVDQALPLGSQGSTVFTNSNKIQFTNLDLIKADTPLTSAKISRMLHQLEFKLHVERQYKEGIDKMAKLYLVDGDKKSRSDTENKRVESKQKMVLLNQALKKYKTLDVMGELGDQQQQDGSIPEDMKANLRRPLSGALEITIKQARDLAHAPQPKKSKHPSETVIYVKVEDTPRARTHPSRNDRWNEDFQIHVDKANEVEVTIYDKLPSTTSSTSTSTAMSSSTTGGVVGEPSSSSSAPVPIGMLWLRLSDIVEELRRRKLGMEAGPGWVTAARVAQGSGGSHGSGSGSGNDVPVTLGRETTLNSGGEFGTGGNGSGGGNGGKGEGIDAWFAVEPEGAILLHLNFVKSNVRKRPYDAGGLGRQGAVRKRKESIHEQNGHKFVVKQFYTVVLCALCGEFLLKGAGMQCEDCKYACHKNCYQKVVTKCISKSNTDADKDEEQINHRIPHRFEPITNISPNWCCHCGLVLPLGRKQARKCSECGVTAHTDCVHLVPDFCGMSMEMANKLLSDIKSINSNRRSGQQRLNQQQQQQQRPLPPPVSTYDSRPPPPQEQLSSDVGRLNLVGGTQHQSTTPVAPSLPPAPQRVPVPPVSPNPYDGIQPSSPAVPPPPAVPAVTPSTTGLNVGPPAPPSHVVQPPPRQSSASGSSSFGNDPRDSIGSLIGGYAGNNNNNEEQQSRQSIPPSQERQQQQNPPSNHIPPQFAPYKQTPPPPSSVVAPQQPGYYGQQPPRMPQPPQPGQIYTPAPPPSSSRLPPGAQQQQQQSPYPAYQQQQQQQVSLPPAPQQIVPRPLPPTTQAQPQPQPQTQGVVRSQRRIGLDDFNFLAVLGKGNFGKVMLAEEKKSSQLYAIKVLKKEFIIENDEVESTKSEKRVFLAAARERHPFLLGLHSCFQTETRIYFVMEYVSGGDLMLHIQREQFTPRRAKFYAAEVLLALEYFHRMGIVYRDLKLDNILLTLDGHVKVADYGLCKEDMSFGKTTSTFCGTPEFMAPEIILEQRYGRAVDWWAFGVLIYEMLLGQSPFRGDDEDEIFDAILEDEPLYPIHMPKDSVSILQKLLTKDPSRRLGASEADAAEIKSHLFFKDTNWDDVFHKRIPSPFFPAISSATDTSNFDSEFTSEQPTLTPVHSTLSAQDQGEFAGFSWTANWAQ